MADALRQLFKEEVATMWNRDVNEKDVIKARKVFIAIEYDAARTHLVTHRGSKRLCIPDMDSYKRAINNTTVSLYKRIRYVKKMRVMAARGLPLVKYLEHVVERMPYTGRNFTVFHKRLRLVQYFLTYPAKFYGMDKLAYVEKAMKQFRNVYKAYTNSRD